MAEIKHGDEISLQDRLPTDAAKLMLAQESDNRGTLASLMNTVAIEAEEMSQDFVFGPGTRETLSLEQQAAFLQLYMDQYPTAQIYARTDASAPRDATFLNSSIMVFTHVTLRGRRITPSRFNGYAPNAIVQANWNGTRYAGEVAFIGTHQQPTRGGTLKNHLFGIRWFVRDRTFDTGFWDP